MVNKFIMLILITLAVASASKDVLRVAMELKYPPFEMTDAKGKPTGFSVDLAKKLGTYLGYKRVKIINISWTGLIPSLLTERSDIIVSSMSSTEQRAKKVDFSIPYANFRLSALVNSKSKIKSLKDMKKGKTVAVKIGTTADIYVTKNLEPRGVKVIRLDSDNSAALEVKQGGADMFLYDQLSVLRYHKRYPKSTYILFVDLPPMAVAIVVKKDKKEFLKKINAFVIKYKKNGGFSKLAKKYLGSEMKEFKRLNAPFLFDK